MTSSSTNHVTEETSRGGWSLAGCTAVIAILWLVVLPWVAERPQMQSHINWLEEQGIDPAAMYYTELEVMEKILQRQRATRNSNPRFLFREHAFRSFPK